MNAGPDSAGADEWHPEVAEISALAEGILPAGPSVRVRDHLTHCPVCADVRESLDEIRGLLGRLPGPPRMPADVAGRIDAALAAEALLSAGAPAAPALPAQQSRGRAAPARAVPDDTASDTAVPHSAAPHSAIPDTGPGTGREPDADAGPRAAHRTATGPAAGPVPPGRDGDEPAPASAAHRAAPTGPARGPRGGPGRPGRPQRRTRGRSALLAAACAAALVGFGTLFVGLASQNGSGGGGDAGAAAKDEAAEATAAGPAVYTDATVDTRVRELLAAPRADSGQDLRRQSSPMAAEQAPDPAAPGPGLPACVLGATDRPGETPLATDLGAYEGRQVGVVVLSERGDERRVRVFLVDSSCESDPSGRPGRVLLERTVTRP
ncbi:hypothetical protein GCM10027168_04860 [Streptomyces capparidis]